MNNLKHIEINIGKACNNKCKFCMSSKPSGRDINFVSLDILKQKLYSYYFKGYKSIGFLGGDISIYPDIIELINYCKEVGFKSIQIISNAMRFSDFNFANKIILAGLTRINISIHSHISIVEDYLTQVPGGLLKKLKAIDNFNLLFQKGLLISPISINIVVNSRNYKTIVETCLYFYNIKNIKDIRLNFIWLSEDIKESWDDLKLSYLDFLPYLKKLIYISLRKNIRITFDTIPACIFYKIDSKNYNFLIIRFIGENFDYIVEIDHINKNIVFNWNYVKEFEEKVKFSQCLDCIYNTFCQGVWKTYPILFGNREFLTIKN